MGTRDKIHQLRASDPQISGAEIADILGISRQRVHQLLADMGLPTGGRRRGRPPNSERKRWRRGGVVYFVRRSSDGYIKIGYSGSIDGRMVSLSSTYRSHGKLELLGAVAGDRATERMLHQAFAVYRHQGEWFLPSDALLAHIAELPPLTDFEEDDTPQIDEFGSMISARRLLAIFRTALAEYDSQTAWAKERGLSPAYVSDVLAGRRDPGKSIAEAFGYRPVTMYEAMPRRRKAKE